MILHVHHAIHHVFTTKNHMFHHTFSETPLKNAHKTPKSTLATTPNFFGENPP
jgi:hypothetical protein